MSWTFSLASDVYGCPPFSMLYAPFDVLLSDMLLSYVFFCLVCFCFNLSYPHLPLMSVYIRYAGTIYSFFIPPLAYFISSILFLNGDSQFVGDTLYKIDRFKHLHFLP
jgi:hypothetical protein